MKVKKLYLFPVVIILSFLSTSIARGLDLRALQDTLRKLGNPWIAGTTSVSELPIEQKRKLCSLMLSPSDAIPKGKIGLSSLPKDSLPLEWDWRDVNGHNWMTAFHYPGDCGIWTFPWVEAMESRIKIANNTPDVDPDLSEQFVISCNSYGYDCSGGCFWNIGDWVMQDGIPDEDCFPYVGADLPCSTRCPDWQQRVVKITNWGVCPQNDTAIKQEIMNGPIAAGITIKEDFFYCKGGVYEPVMGEKMGIYPIICAGWDSSSAWLCKNLDYFANWFYAQVIEHPTWMVPEAQGVEESVNYPEISGLVLSHNPSRSTVSLSFYLPDARKVSINIYDIAGREISCLANKLFQAGNHKIAYNRDKLPPGIYFLILKSDRFIDSRKLILL